MIPVKLEPDQDTDTLMQMLLYPDSFLENHLIYEEEDSNTQKEGYKSCDLMQPDF